MEALWPQTMSGPFVDSRSFLDANKHQKKWQHMYLKITRHRACVYIIGYHVVPSDMDKRDLSQESAYGPCTERKMSNHLWNPSYQVG